MIGKRDIKKEKARKYYLKNRVRIIEKSKKYYLDNRDSVQLCVRDYKLKNKGRIKQHRKEHTWLFTYWNAYKGCYTDKSSSYYKKDTKMLMTKEDFKTLWFRDKAYEMQEPSIDRLNSKGHYELSNCRYLELKENRMRRYCENL